MKEKEYGKAVWTTCKKCGKRFLAHGSGALYCGDPCQSPASLRRVEGPVPANERTKMDCKALVKTERGYLCRGLSKLYCNKEDCKFYKPKE